MDNNFKEIGKYESEEGSVRVLLDEENKMLCDVTMDELTKLLGFHQKRALEKLIERNPRIRTTKFSRIELMQTAGGIQETRLFTERGILEVAFLASTEKAEKFRDDIYDLLVSLREKNMISFGANGLDVKLLEQVKEQMEEAVGKDERLEEKLDMFLFEFEEFKKDREAIKFVREFDGRLAEDEIDIVIIQKELKKMTEEIEHITKMIKKLGGK